MASSSSLDYWRKLFRSTSSDIFEVLENAIGVAASDRPEEFLVRRDQIAQKLFTCRLDRCLGCDRIQQPPPGDPEEEEEEEEEEDDGDGSLGEGLGGGDGDPNSNYSYDEAEALTEEIEEETQTVGEVLRIKRILDHHQDESDSVLFDSLRRLQLMALSVETLKATGIGKAVNRLRKHNKEIRQLAKTLIDGWKLLVDEWVNAAPAIPNNSPDSVTPSGLDEEEGLPSPPLDEVALFATQTTSIPLSEFFDGMDDDGNLRNEGELYKKRENGRSLENQKPVRKQQQQYHSHSTVPEYKEHRRQEPAVRQLKPKLSEGPSGQSKPQGIIKTKLCNTGSGHERPGRLGSEQKGRCNLNSGVQKKHTDSPHDKIKLSEDASVKAKVEVSKRKLQERYQQAENAKKQRTIQVMELHDLPKQGHHQNSRLPSSVKHRSNIRNLASMRR